MKTISFQEALATLVAERAELRRLFGELNKARILADRATARDTVDAIAELVLLGLGLDDPRHRPGAPTLVGEVEHALDTMPTKYLADPAEYWSGCWNAERWSISLKLRVQRLCCALDSEVGKMLSEAAV